MIRPGCMYCAPPCVVEAFCLPRNRPFCYSDATQNEGRTRLFFSSASLLHLPKNLPALRNLMVAVRFSTPCASLVFSTVNYRGFTYMGILRVHPVVSEDDASKRRRNEYGLRKTMNCRDAFGKYSRYIYIRLQVPRRTYHSVA